MFKMESFPFMRVFPVFVFVALTFSFVAAADSQTSDVPSYATALLDGVKIPNDLRKELDDALRGKIKTFDQSVYFYNYASREGVGVNPIGNLDVTDPKISNHVQGWATYYWDKANPGSAGSTDTSGLYLATDPVSSRNFGKEHWLLFRIEIPSGSSYLSLIQQDESDEATVPTSLAKKLGKYGCNIEGGAHWNLLFRRTSGQQCRAITLRVLLDLGVTAIAYPYESVNFVHCMNTRDQEALILLRPEQIPASAQKVFYSEMADSDPERSYIEQLFVNSYSSQPVDDPSRPPLQMHMADRPWPSLDSHPRIGLDEFMKRHLVGCDKSPNPSTANSVDCKNSQPSTPLNPADIHGLFLPAQELHDAGKKP